MHCYSKEEDIPADLGVNVRTIDRIYPELKIDLLFVRGDYGPPLIEAIAKRLKIQKNYMFIGTPSDRFPHSLASLGGVRLHYVTSLMCASGGFCQECRLI